MKEVSPAVWCSESEPPRVSIAWMTRPRSGENVNGDAVVVRRLGHGVLVAIIDALGHGPKAAEVADSSVRYLDAAVHRTVSELVHGLHDALHGSRGAAALLFLLSENGVEVCSVGNVELRSTNKKLPFVLTPGVLGLRLRQPRICGAVAKAERVDRFILHSDGISGGFDLKAHSAQSPCDVAKHIFTTHRLSHDDATVVVLDVL
jgi:phosphoserine phosphatase RsbX